MDGEGDEQMSAAGVTVSTAPFQWAGAGSSPSAALRSLEVKPIPATVAKRLLKREHYLHSYPGGTFLSFGVFAGAELAGAVTFGVGPSLAHRLVDGATRHDCASLTRLWLSDGLPANSESRVLGVVLRSLRRHTNLRFLVTYADPAAGHHGTIYQATGWLYTGLSEATPLYDLGDGKTRHSRSVGQVFGTHSIRRLGRHGLSVKLVPQVAKHRYLYFLGPKWRSRLSRPVLPYPKREVALGHR